MENYDYLQKIIEFNSDKDIIALREKYKEPTFFEIISKQRSETIYSSFLKWMFQSSSTDLSTVSPLLLLLDILVQHSQKQDNSTVGLIDEDLKKHIITRNFKINNIEVETEKSVSMLASQLSSNGATELKKLKEDEIKKLIAKCQDRIDIFIRCNIEINNENKELQIIIENKIDSTQGGQKPDSKINVDRYTNASQTDRYYMATASNNKELYQLYVYLLPKSSDYTRKKINDRLDEHQNQKNKETLEQLKINDNFIEIYYQDIVDGIVIPMLASSTLSTRERFFLEELKTELTFPSLESDNVRNSIAISDENAERFSKLWNEKYSKLIIDSAIATSESEIWWIGDHYYNYQPKVELINQCLDKKSNDEVAWLNKDEPKGKCAKKLEREEGVYYYNSSYWYSKIEEHAKSLGLETGNTKSNDDNSEANNNKPLLESFWNSNRRFLLAFMNGLKNEDMKKIKCLTDEVSKRDTTKYKVYYNDKSLNESWLSGKSANNAETAWLIIKAWAEKENDSQKKIDIKTLRDKFRPKDCNTYYKSGKWLKHLFYEYKADGKYTADGEENKGIEIEAGGWDFYKPKNIDDKKFIIETADGPVAMVKMWRKDGLQNLISLVKDKYFKNQINIQPDK